MFSPSKVFMKCSSCKDIRLLPVGQQVCNRCLLHQERERADKAEQARDRYAQLLHLAGKILGDVPDAQVKDNQGKVWDGDYLAAHIQDVLEDKA